MKKYPHIDDGIKAIVGSLLFGGGSLIALTKYPSIFLLPLIIITFYFWMIKKDEKYSYWFAHCAALRAYEKFMLGYPLSIVLIDLFQDVTPWMDGIFVVHMLIIMIGIVVIQWRCHGKM